MKKYLITICLAVGIALPAAAQFTPIKIGENAKKVIINRYDTNYAFHDGLLAVKNDETGLCGFIDEQGNKVIDYQWDYKSFGYPQFGGGACLVCKSGRDMWGRTETWYVINKQGRAIKLNARIIDSAPFNKDGYALIVKTVNDRYSKCTYIDRQGREVFPALVQTMLTVGAQSPEFEDIRNFYLGYAYAQFKDRRYMDIVDENFNVVRPQLENKMLDPTRRNGEPIEFINGYSTWAGSPGASLPFLLSPIGKMLRFSSDWGESIDVKHRTEKVIHVKLKKYDGFIDYDGNIVFYFAEDEF
ncbi:WG repeat-containing protein [uncultured Bacteroides sp.]|uniref:WG repeat-containing protein n=1 Tax=uncultured Bacteroides sp. TaxID=162156 RepID=UPI002594EC70|nr:WG repeat-containing protein [uncultured Bacteroides sp.]